MSGVTHLVEPEMGTGSCEGQLVCYTLPKQHILSVGLIDGTEPREDNDHLKVF